MIGSMHIFFYYIIHVWTAPDARINCHKLQQLRVTTINCAVWLGADREVLLYWLLRTQYMYAIRQYSRAFLSDTRHTSFYVVALSCYRFIQAFMLPHSTLIAFGYIFSNLSSGNRSSMVCCQLWIAGIPCDRSLLRISAMADVAILQHMKTTITQVRILPARIGSFSIQPEITG